MNQTAYYFIPVYHMVEPIKLLGMYDTDVPGSIYPLCNMTFLYRATLKKESVYLRDAVAGFANQSVPTLDGKMQIKLPKAEVKQLKKMLKNNRCHMMPTDALARRVAKDIKKLKMPTEYYVNFAEAIYMQQR